MATAKRREWTKTDVRELKTLARQRTPARKIARSLKRSEGATRQKAFSLGVSLDSRALGLRTAYSPLFAWEDCTFFNQFVTTPGRSP